MNRKEAIKLVDTMFDESRDNDGGPGNSWSGRSYALSDLAEFLAYMDTEKDEVISLEPERTEVHIVENFQLEFESDDSSVLRWYKQTQPRHEDYVFKITIDTIKRKTND